MFSKEFEEGLKESKRLQYTGKHETHGYYNTCVVCKEPIYIKYSCYSDLGTWEDPIWLHTRCSCYHALTDEMACFNPESPHFRRKCIGYCDKHKEITDNDEFNKSQDFHHIMNTTDDL